MSFSQYWIVSVFKLEGKPSLGNESNSGHLYNCKDERDGRRVTIPSGSDFNFLQLKTSISVNFQAQIPPLRKDTKVGHLEIFK